MLQRQTCCLRLHFRLLRQRRSIVSEAWCRLLIQWSRAYWWDRRSNQSTLCHPIVQQTPPPTIRTEDPSPRTPRVSDNESPLTPRSDRWIIQRMDELSSELQQLQGSQSPQSLTAPPIELPQIHIERPREGSGTVDAKNDAPLLSAASSGNDDRAADRPLLKSETPASALPVLGPRQNRTSRDEIIALLAESRMQPAPKIAPEPLPSVSKYSAPPQPTINVTIGRVEVKATRDAAPQPRQSQPKSSPSVMSLQDYLARRAAGGLP